MPRKYGKQRGGAMVMMPVRQPIATASASPGMLGRIGDMIGIAAPVRSFMDKFKTAQGWRGKLNALRDGIKDNKLLSRSLRAIGTFTGSDIPNHLASAAQSVGYGRRRKVGRPTRKQATSYAKKKTTTTRRKTVRRRQVGGAMSRSSMGSQRFVLQPVWPSPSTIIA